MEFVEDELTIGKIDIEKSDKKLHIDDDKSDAQLATRYEHVSKTRTFCDAKNYEQILVVVLYMYNISLKKKIVID